MPEAVIVSTARSPIGRAAKGTLVDVRPDDLTASIVRAALDKVPQLDPADIDDLMLGCGLPGGEQGFNLARVVAVLLGHPNGMTGARITTTLINSLQFHEKELGLETMCVGGGQGMAMVIERLS